MALAHGAVAAPDRKDFRWRAPVLEPVQSGLLYRAILPLHVFDGSRAFPADVRLLDEHGAEWPFFIGMSTNPPLRLSVPWRLSSTNANSRDFEVELTVHHVPLREVQLPWPRDLARLPPDSQVNVWGRKTATNQWRPLADDAPRYDPEAGRLTIDLRDRVAKFLRFEFDGDRAAPFAGESLYVFTLAREIVFRPLREGRAWLYFGSDAPGFPLHELQHQLRPEDLAATRHAAIGPREENPYRLRAELRHYAELLVLSTVVIAGLLATGLLLKRMRQP